MYADSNTFYYLSLLLPCNVSLFGAACLLLRHESNTRSQKILAIGFFISALFFLCTANYVARQENPTTFMWWDILDSFVTLIVIPTMFLYFRSMINADKFTWREYIWFVPALVVGIGNAVLYALMDKAGMQEYIHSVLIDKEPIANYPDIIYRLHYFIGISIYNSTAAVQIIGTSILAINGLRTYHRQLQGFYSDASEKSTHIESLVIRWFLVTIPLSFALIFLDIQFWESRPLFASLFFICWAVVYFALFYYGTQKRHTADNFAQDLMQADLEEPYYNQSITEKPQDSAQDKPISSELYHKITVLLAQLIDRDKIYLKSDLRLDEVARLMCTNRAYVSKVIKEEYHCSFSDYINLQRVHFSMEIMRSQQQLTQDIIAEKSGFINAQSYSRTFKKIVGIPPKQWALNNQGQHQG